MTSFCIQAQNKYNHTADQASILMDNIIFNFCRCRHYKPRQPTYSEQNRTGHTTKNGKYHQKLI